MVAVRNSFKKLPKIPAKKIPAALIYEVIDGKPIYYKGYREVLNGTKKSSEIMGASTLQNMIIQYILRILFRNLDENKFHILTNEQGLHLENKINLSADIAVFETSTLPLKAADKHYASVPPKIQIEVDIDADIEDFESSEAYINLKTDKLLAFGVEKVIWILSESKKVMIATKDENWQIINWHKEIEIMEGLTFNIGQYLQEGESPFA
jgi:Uma2 family endonuclease